MFLSILTHKSGIKDQRLHEDILEYNYPVLFIQNPHILPLLTTFFLISVYSALKYLTHSTGHGLTQSAVICDTIVDFYNDH